MLAYVYYFRVEPCKYQNVQYYYFNKTDKITLRGFIAVYTITLSQFICRTIIMVYVVSHKGVRTSSQSSCRESYAGSNEIFRRQPIGKNPQQIFKRCRRRYGMKQIIGYMVGTFLPISLTRDSMTMPYKSYNCTCAV